MSASVGLPEALERAASALPGDADAIRPANGDPAALLRALDAEAAARVLGWLLAHEPEAGAELADTWAEDPGRGERSAAAPARRRAAQGGSQGAEPRAAPPALARHRARRRRAGGGRGEAPADRGRARGGLRLGGRPARHAHRLSRRVESGGRRAPVRAGARRRARRRRVRGLRHRPQQGAPVPARSAQPRALPGRRGAGRRRARADPADRRGPAGRAPAAARLHRVSRPRGRAEARRAHAGRARARGAGRGRRTPRRSRARPSWCGRHEIGPWPAAAPVLEKVAERIGELAKSPLVVSPAARREQAQSLLAEAQAEVFAEPVAAHTAQRFEESAYVLWKTGREQDAKACLAAAQAFRAGAAGGEPGRPRAARDGAGSGARRPRRAGAARGGALAAREALSGTGSTRCCSPRVAIGAPRSRRGATRSCSTSCATSLPEDLQELRDLRIDIPLAKWNRIAKNVHADRKLVGGAADRLREATRSAWSPP